MGLKHRLERRQKNPSQNETTCGDTVHKTHFTTRMTWALNNWLHYNNFPFILLSLFLYIKDSIPSPPLFVVNKIYAASIYLIMYTYNVS